MVYVLARGGRWIGVYEAMFRGVVGLGLRRSGADNVFRPYVCIYMSTSCLTYLLSYTGTKARCFSLCHGPCVLQLKQAWTYSTCNIRRLLRLREQLTY